MLTRYGILARNPGQNRYTQIMTQLPPGLKGKLGGESRVTPKQS